MTKFYNNVFLIKIASFSLGELFPADTLTSKSLLPSESLLVKSFNSRKIRECDEKENHFAIKGSLKFSNASTHCKATGKDREKIYCIAWMMLQSLW